MATYKVIQDIEAEDKLIGWMTPRQTVYAAIVAVSGFICFLLITRGAWWLALPMLPHMILFAVLSGPFVHDQPSEVWLLAKITFFLKPRRRIWDQSGLKELVTITVPKKVEKQLTDGLSQTEVKSRLQALANTIDSRGWAIKNISTNLYAQPSYAAASTDRLIDTSTIPQEVPAYDITPSDDILDETNNPTAQHMQQMINQSAQAHRQQLIAQMKQPPAPAQPAQPAQQWFVDPMQSQQLPSDAEEKLISADLHQRKSRGMEHMNMRGISPDGNAKSQAETKQKTPKSNPNVVQQLANNNDLNVATIARQANKKDEGDLNGDNEVVVSLR